jgi:hypothetical protein
MVDEDVKKLIDSISSYRIIKVDDLVTCQYLGADSLTLAQGFYSTDLQLDNYNQFGSFHRGFSSSPQSTNSLPRLCKTPTSSTRLAILMI